MPKFCQSISSGSGAYSSLSLLPLK